MSERDSSKITDWRKDLFSEKSLYAGAGISFSFVGGARERRFLLFLFVGMLIASVMASILRPELVANLDAQLKFLSSSSGDLFGFYSTMLGFVIAGFTILIGVMDKKNLQNLAQVKHKGRDISEFKFVYYSFILTLIVFGFGTFIFGLLHFVCKENGVAELLVATFNENIWVRSMGLILNVTSITFFVYSILMLKSFVWNIYQLVLVNVVIKDVKDASQ